MVEEFHNQRKMGKDGVKMGKAFYILRVQLKLLIKCLIMY